MGYSEMADIEELREQISELGSQLDDLRLKLVNHINNDSIHKPKYGVIDHGPHGFGTTEGAIERSNGHGHIGT